MAEYSEDFLQWARQRRYRSPAGNDVLFDSLPDEEKQKIHEQWSRGQEAARQQQDPDPLMSAVQQAKEGGILVVDLAAQLGMTPEKVLETAMPRLMDGTIHLEEGPKFVDWSGKSVEERGEALPMPRQINAKIRLAMQQVRRG